MKYTHPCNIIARHLFIQPKCPIIETLPEDTVCAFTGQKITKGVLAFDTKIKGERRKTKGLIGSNFTEHQYLRYPSDYISLEVAKCMSIIEGNKGLRNYRFVANDKGMKLLDREAVIPTLLNPPQAPFVLCVSFAVLPKKHLSYKATVNYSRESYFVETNKGKIEVNRALIAPLITDIQEWYTEVPDNPKQTYFTKEEILGNREPSWNKVNRYKKQHGSHATYIRQNKSFNQYRGTLLFEFLVNFIQRKKVNEYEQQDFGNSESRN